MTTETKVLTGILVATLVIIVGGAFVFSSKSKPPTQVVTEPERLVRASSPILGPADAKVTIVEFGDFQCPACGALYPTLKQLKEKNKDKSVRFVYRHFPLSNHEFALPAAEAAVEAQQQGKFWEYHDVLFEHQDKLTRSDLEGYAQQLGLNMEAFKQAVQDNTHRDRVLEDRGDGQALHIAGTPSLFINNRAYNGTYSVEEMQKVIDEELNKSNE